MAQPQTLRASEMRGTEHSLIRGPISGHQDLISGVVHVIQQLIVTLQVAGAGDGRECPGGKGAFFVPLA